MNLIKLIITLILFITTGIVSAETAMSCPERVFTETELTDIINKQRAIRTDLPTKFNKTRIEVMRLRCLYLYFEHSIPESLNHYHVFTIDQFGELMEFSGNP